MPRAATGSKGRFTHKRVQSAKKFAKGSFRTIDPGRTGHTKIVVACPKGQWKATKVWRDPKTGRVHKGRCKVGMQEQAILIEKQPARRKAKGKATTDRPSG